MAASAVAGAAKAIGSALVTDAKYLVGVEDQFRAVQGDLVCMQQFLQDVDANPNLPKQDGQLRILCHEMQMLAFQAEDAIDTYVVNVESKFHEKNFFKKLVGLASHFYPVHMLMKEIEAIQQEIKVVIARSGNFRANISSTGQLQGDFAGSSYSKLAAENYIHLSEEFVVGIGDEIARLVNRLTDPQDDFQVLGIVGTGGGGKSTLASEIYRHAKVKSSFSHTTFVSISQKWSRLDILQRIYMDIFGQSNISSTERELMTSLYEFMKDKRCLVVLDDIWKKQAWDDIHYIFPRTHGIRVILTTRILEVPLYADKKCILHEPQMLTGDQMWELFSKIAVTRMPGIENDAEFENLGKLMLQKCHGLPLAVVTLAGILRTKTKLFEWKRVSVALSDNIFKGRSSRRYEVVEEMFELSYLELPAHLRPLFLCLAFMSEDKVWTSKQLIQMWIAEGFIANDHKGRYGTLEEKGMQFICELANRFIVQVRKMNHRNEVELIYMHYLMREFCIKKASQCMFLENASFTHSYRERKNKPRRLSIISREYLLEKNNFVRTIVYDGLSCNSGDRGLRQLESIDKDFKLLRVLRISNCANKTLPKETGNLILLTYLSIEDTKITELPESVRNLSNLIYLVFSQSLDEGETAKVPDDLVVNMENLRVLRLPDRLQKLGSSNCKRLGLNSEKHKKLHTFRCGAGRWMRKDLIVMHLLPLTDLHITNIDEIEEMEAIDQCIGFLEGSLQTFRCEINGVTKELNFDSEKLMGSQSLEILCLWGRLVYNYAIQFPAHLVSLALGDSEIGEGVDLMGVLGHLSKLKYLIIESGAYLGTQLHCTSTSFPQLEELELSSLDSLEKWTVEKGAMDRLKKITVFDCPKLKRLPEGIRYITTLKELEIEAMPEEFCWRLGFNRDEDGGTTSTIQTQGGEDSYIFEHVPSIKVVPVKHTDTIRHFWRRPPLIPHYPANEPVLDSNMGDGKTTWKEMVLKYVISEAEDVTAHIPEVYTDEKVVQSDDAPTNQVQAVTAHDRATESYSDSNLDDNKESTLKSGLSGGDPHLNADIPEVYNDEKVIQSLYEQTDQVQAGTTHDPAMDSNSDSNVDDNKESTLKSGFSREDSLADQTESQSPISPDDVTQLASPAPTEIVPVWKEYQNTPHDVENQGTDDNNDMNKEEAKRLLFLFGEGYEFEKQMLIQLWMALGLLADEPMEENGAYYFENLVSEGYILGSVPNYLYRVNFQKLGIEDRSCIKLDSTRRNSDSSAETLHVSVVCDEINASVFQTLRGFSRLRTLLFLGSNGSRLQQLPRDLFLCYESLEALDLSGTHIKELPSSAGKMINLRYLDLSWTFLEALPERIDRFKKLQTLKLEGCSRLRTLPNETKGLTDLRHLHLDVLRDLSAFPKGVGALVNLRTLSAFPVGIEQGVQISELKYLDHITGSFCIAKIENVQSADVAKEAFLNNKKNIKKLKLRWSNHKMKYRRNEDEFILQNLCPWSDLEELQIECYPGIKLPDWIADVSFDKLVNISLFGCVKVNMLPSMGKLLSLESLELISFNSVTKMDFKGVAADYVAFPKLQKLSVEGMLNLKTWAKAGEGDYPCIEELSIKDCPKLREFPSVVYAPSLKHLEASGCKRLVLKSNKTLPKLEELIVEDCPLMEERCSKDRGQDWHKIQHVPTIWVNQVAVQEIEFSECSA